eukprot:scaffold783_cov313-Chaetoceros_neogracile.AAC.7
MVETRSQRKVNEEPAATATETATDNSSTNSNTNFTTGALQETDNSNSAQQESESKTPLVTIVSFAIIALISYFTYPDTLQPVGRPTLNHVWYFGWISALSTGLGVLPLIFSPKLDSYWIGVTNGKKIDVMPRNVVVISCDVM